MRRLDRRNAQRFDSDSSSGEQEPQPQDLHEGRPWQLLNLLPPTPVGTSFRIDGTSDSAIIIRNLGLSGPEDFTIPAAAWAARKFRSPSSDCLQSSRLQHLDRDLDGAKTEVDTPTDNICGPRPPPLLELTPSSDAEVGVEAADGVRVELEVVSVVVDEGETVGESMVSSVDDSSSGAATEVDVSPEARAQHTISEWSLGKELGRGSFGTVYEAINFDGFFFAVKEVSLLDQGNNAQQCIQQLEHEIALLSHMEHPNIVRYLGTERGEAKLFIFLELVTQGSLAHLYQKYQLRDSQVSSYTRQILHGLKYLHGRNVVHRDIKCANILVDASGSVKLADFGLAKETSKINMLKSCKGSVYWMAPEVIVPQRTYGSAADIWSLGCTVLEMLTQDIPYPNLEWTQAFFRIGRGERPPIPESLSNEARDFISQCVQQDPGDRPDAEELLSHPFVLRQYSAGAAISLDGSSHGRRLQAT